MKQVELTDKRASELEILSEVVRAYADANGDWTEDSMRLRNLNFRASGSVDPAMAVQIMSKATPRGYNAFEPKLLGLFAPDTKITLARELSVCIYAQGEHFPDQSALRCDEYEITGNVLRVWWD